MSDHESLIAAERARCLRIVESYLGTLGSFPDMLINRMCNIIRNGIVPEAFWEQMSSTEPTDYLDPQTVEQERERCIQCIEIHYDEEAPLAERAMLLDIEDRIAFGDD